MVDLMNEEIFSIRKDVERAKSLIVLAKDRFSDIDKEDITKIIIILFNFTDKKIRR
jgi:hypothetical protein